MQSVGAGYVQKDYSLGQRVFFLPITHITEIAIFLPPISHMEKISIPTTEG